MKTTIITLYLKTTMCFAILLMGLKTYCQTSTVKYYDRYGMPIGQAKIEPERNSFAPTYVPTLPTYEPTVPIDMVLNAGRAKQQTYDVRKKWIQDALDGIGNNIKALHEAGYVNDVKELFENYRGLVRNLNENQGVNDWSEKEIFDVFSDKINNLNQKVRQVYEQVNSRHNNIDSENYVRNYNEELKAKINEKDYEACINLLTEAYDETHDSYYIGWRGIVYAYYIRDFDKAVIDLSKMIQMKPNESKGYYYRGETFKSMKNYEDAVTDFTNCIQYDTENLNAYFNRAICKSELGDRGGAIKDYDQIIKIGNDNGNHQMQFLMGTVYNNKAYCLFELGQNQEALKWINMALEIAPQEDYIWQSRGEVYYKLGKYSDAISDLNKSIELLEEKTSKAKGSDNSLGYYIRGMAKFNLGDKSGACNDLSKAGELGNADAYKAIREKCR